jgi:hypothetical protein
MIRMNFINEIKDYQKHLEGCAGRAFDKGEAVQVTLVVSGKEIDFTLNADMHDSIYKMLQDEINYLDYHKEDFGQPNDLWYLVEWYDENDKVRQSEVKADYLHKHDGWLKDKNYPSYNIVKEMNKPSKQNIR